MKLVEQIGLGELLKIEGDEKRLPATSFQMNFRGQMINVELIPDTVDSQGGHFITAFYYETINQGTWGDIKVFFTWGQLGQPDTIRHNIITQSDGYKTYGITYK